MLPGFYSYLSTTEIVIQGLVDRCDVATGLVFSTEDAFDKDFIKAYPNSCFQSTQDMIKKLDLRMLKNIFSAAKGADFLTEAYLKDILMRRDMIVEFCNQKAGN